MLLVKQGGPANIRGDVLYLAREMSSAEPRAFCDSVGASEINKRVGGLLEQSGVEVKMVFFFSLMQVTLGYRAEVCF